MTFFSYVIKFRKNIIKNVIIILCTIFLYELFFCGTTVIESEDSIYEKIDVGQNIAEASEYVVGISKTYDISDEGWGSGIIISKNGYILTNEHVANESCYVIVNTKSKYKANLVWSDKEIDLAILKVEHQFDKCAILGDSYDLKVGQNVYAIGNPISYDFYRSVSSGIISGLDRNIELNENNEKFYLFNLIQTDININPGNSGGALINELGEIIGVTTVKMTSQDGISFSVPINIIKNIITKLDQNQIPTKMKIGIIGYDKFSIGKYNDNIILDSGIYIAIVEPYSKAEYAGIKTGDIIRKIDGITVNSLLELRSILYDKAINKNAYLTIERDNKIYEVLIK